MSFNDTQTGGMATVNVNDGVSTNSATGNLSFSSPNETVSGLGFGAGGSLSFNTGTPGTTALNVTQGTSSGGTGGVTTNVTGTPSTLPTKITGGSNTNTFNIGGAAPGNLSNVVGSVTIAGGGAAASAIDVNDQSTNAVETYTVTSTTVARIGTFGGLTYSGIGSLTLNPGIGSNTINVTSTLNGSTTNVNGDGGSSMINVNGTGTSGTLNVATAAAVGSTVNVVADSSAGERDDQRYADARHREHRRRGGTGNLQGITGLVTLTGNQPYALTINDQGDVAAQTYNVNILSNATNTGAALLGTTQFLSFHPNSLTGLTFNGGNHGNVINFNDLTPANVTTSIFAGAGNDTTNLRGSGAGSTVNVDSQAGTNAVVLGGQTNASFPLGARWLLGTAVNVAPPAARRP